MKIYNKRHFLSTIIIVGLFMLSGCLSMSSLQTGRTMGKGEFGGGIAGGTFAVGVDNKDDTLTQQALGLDRLESPFGEIYVKYGITDRLDVGGKLTLIGTGNVDIKYRFLGSNESKGAISAGMSIGTVSVNDQTIFDVHVPVYLSFHPSNWFAIYSTPRYVLRNIEGTSSNWFGLTGGVRIGGKKFGVFGEYTYITNSVIDQPTTQVAIGLGFNIK